MQPNRFSLIEWQSEMTSCPLCMPVSHLSGSPAWRQHWFKRTVTSNILIYIMYRERERERERFSVCMCAYLYVGASKAGLDFSIDRLIHTRARQKPSREIPNRQLRRWCESGSIIRKHLVLVILSALLLLPWLLLLASKGWQPYNVAKQSRIDLFTAGVHTRYCRRRIFP